MSDDFMRERGVLAYGKGGRGGFAISNHWGVHLLDKRHADPVFTEQTKPLKSHHQCEKKKREEEDEGEGEASYLLVSLRRNVFRC